MTKLRAGDLLLVGSFFCDLGVVVIPNPERTRKRPQADARKKETKELHMPSLAPKKKTARADGEVHHSKRGSIRDGPGSKTILPYAATFLLAFAGRSICAWRMACTAKSSTVFAGSSLI